VKLAFVEINFRSKTLELLGEIDVICSEFYSDGYILTLRQVFYQLVTRNRIANTEREYKNLGATITNGRYAGVLDWEHIQDRVRIVQRMPHWENPANIIHAASRSYGIDTWAGQEYRAEVWIEKDALIEIAARPCERLDVPYIAVKAYSSTSAMWEARKRFREYIRNGQTPVILHLGDHDSTGADCSRHLEEKMQLLVGRPIELRRLALNRDQIGEYELPPQPGKTADPRFKGYVKKHGTSNTWELDALSPRVIETIIEDGIRDVLNEDRREEHIARQERERESLKQVSTHWNHVEDFATKVMPNGRRDGYEAWRCLIGLDGDARTVVKRARRTPGNKNRSASEKSTIVDFQPYRIEPRPLDPEIAEQYAQALGLVNTARVKPGK